MPTVIRMVRVGTTKKPRYRIVVADHSFPRDGRHIEILGHYNPFDRVKGLVIDRVKVDEWVKKGAKPSNTVLKLIKNTKPIS